MQPFALQAGLDLLGPETLPFLLVATGLVLAILETTAPGAHFIVVGAALFSAGLVGLVGAQAGLGVLAGPFALGGMVVLFGLATLWAYRTFEIYPSEGGQTSDSASLRGSTGRVTERVTPSGGGVVLDDGGFDPHYTARSVDGEIPEETEVVVVDPGGGNVLTVESFERTDSIDRALSEGREREPAAETTADRDQNDDHDHEHEREPEPEREAE
jgi:membrane protein implicated in regulation of membrane protease activity